MNHPGARQMQARHPVLSVAALLEHTATMGALAELVGLSTRTLHRYRQTGLTVLLADRGAAALKLHPVEVWPEWFELAEQERRTRNAAYERARYRTDPRVRAARAVSRRAYYNENRSYEQARERDRYRAYGDGAARKREQRAGRIVPRDSTTKQA